MDPVTIAALGLMTAGFVYHKWFEDHPKPPPSKDISLPRTDDGAPIPFIYGLCRVRTPVLAYAGDPQAVFFDGFDTNGVSVYLYTLDMFYILGIPFYDGNNHIHAMWAGEYRLDTAPTFGANIKQFWELNGNGDSYFTGGNHEYAKIASPSEVTPGAPITIGTVEFLNGGSTQELIEQGTFAHKTVASSFMESYGGVAPSLIPGYRGYMCAFLFDVTSAAGGKWVVGSTAQVPAYSFEVSSYPTTSLDQQMVGVEANPADVIYDLLKGVFAKLGLSAALVDYETFRAAAEALRIEGHGYSRAIEGARSAGEIIQEILVQIDAVMYEDPFDGKIKLKLIRGDYDPQDCLEITVDNCKELQNPAAGGWTGRANKIRILFTDRQNSYADGSATAQNQANAVGQDGLVEEYVVQMPGVCTQALADDIAGRELAARSRPMFKTSAIVDRSFLRIVPGDVVALTWPDWHINGMLMRVAGVTRGSLENGAIKLDLIQDTFYSRRGHLIDGGLLGTLGSFPTEVGLG